MSEEEIEKLYNKMNYKNWYENHKKQKIEYNKKWNKENKEKRKEINKKYRKKIKKLRGEDGDNEQ